jgi:RimJ/RimL family protein N-acetyltransferase
VRWIGIPYWNNGYCTEAGRVLIEYGFNERSARVASGRVLEKLGMKIEGTQREHITKLGEYEDLVLVGLQRSEWLKRERRHNTHTHMR